ncbi:glycosyltransferase family 4 protein [Mucilaginibacter phyllosphaerae]|uniref:Glycosyltransferase family 1 protein n=1 Tax=Mucilaginibacter phyllosphaerae TaxID=1812349 RepID=A0A4Y8AJW1_9SPHI|nr:glycosyltransferase family 4 protein [Mucilaginibacter phyllosphaerae]MBB3968055.1 glycosyltransferase involved in cell wall biosynthesis [Mucilaginibacter phyllosphaerae]TEW68922.1 glycosyltransferase family 1 protein [Mucilaginibacter phyllosphaerae]GGH01516.1 LPS biosynthesis-related transferase [Mucilaginibacter phyllosphaerae]
MQKKLKVFTWHIHGSYLFYLAQGNYDIYIPTKPEKTEGYYGRGETFPFGDNVIEIPAGEVKYQEFDCIIFQTNTNYLVDQYEILTAEQRELPRIYIEHDPPRQHPTDTRHVVADENVVLVHVTHFNRLMWDSNQTPTRVIEHGVTDAGVHYRGDLDRGIVVINNLPARGRLLGHDIFMYARKHVPLDLVGMGTGSLGLGEVLHPQLPQFQSRYRFFFNPIRYTSLGLAVCEAMMMGIPVVGLATTELSAVIENGVSGFIHTDVDYLIDKMKLLISNAQLAQQIGSKGREVALQRFSIQRFTRDWENLLNEVTAKTRAAAA